MSVQMYHESKSPHFSCIFFEHGYLTYYSTYSTMCIAEICLEGRVSQIFYLGLSFCFMPYRKRNFERKYQNSQKLPVFCHKIKTKT